MGKKNAYNEDKDSKTNLPKANTEINDLRLDSRDCLSSAELMALFFCL